MGTRIIFVLLGFMWACTTTLDPDVPEMGFPYQPDILGREMIYQVDSTRIDDFNNGKDTTLRYFLREKVEGYFVNAVGEKSQRIARYVRLKDNDPWRLQRIYTRTIGKSDVQEVHHNERYIKLVFPVADKVKWNGNAYNTQGPLNYTITQIHKPMALGTLNFDSTLTVMHQQDSNFLEKRFRKEIFARGVGMIYQQVDTILYRGYRNFPNGVYYRQSLLSYTP